jgi:hypothetical protein
VPEIHIVEQGESLSRLADRFGFSDWHTIYDHPSNETFRRDRPNPETLLPGDKIYIPDRQIRHESGVTERRHRFEVRLPEAWIRLVLKDALGRALSNLSYTLRVGSKTQHGTTDAEGALRGTVPIHIEHGTLTLDSLQRTWRLKIGHLDPVQNKTAGDPIVSGIQARLNNLGYWCGKVDGLLGPKTRTALQRFQRAALRRPQADGSPDAQTCTTLEACHGS